MASLFKQYWRYGLGTLVVLVLGWYFFGSHGVTSGANLTIVPGDFSEQVSVSGTVIAAKDVDLGFAASGRISGTYITVGQHVGAGVILAETENGDLLAVLAEAKANLAQTLAGTRPEELAVASAAVASAKAALADAVQSAYSVSDDAVHNRVDAFFTNPRNDPKLSFSIGSASLKTTVEHDRASIEPVLTKWALLAGKVTSDSASNSAVQAQTYLGQVATLLADASAALNQGIPDQNISAATLSTYSSALSIGRTNVNTAMTTLTSTIATLDAAEKNLTLKQSGSTAENIAAQQAVVAAAQSALTKTRIYAPFGGIVTRMDAKVGAIVSPSTSLIALQSDGTFDIETYVSEVSISGVANGNRATTTLDAYGPSVAFPATVVAVDPAETMKDGVPTYKTTLAFLRADPRIRSGMTANVVIETGVLKNAIVIPAGAVTNKSGISYVSVLDADKKPVSRTVTTGISPMLGQIQILSGLSAGDVIELTPAL